MKELLAHRLIVVLGKGGVGRTSISAAIGARAARHGLRTLIIEADLNGPITASYGRRPGFEQVELETNLFAMTLGGQESLEEYLSLVTPRPILRMVFASALYRYFVHAAPALRELTMMGKVYHEIERRAAPLKPWNMVVFDAPASGLALRMIRTPFAARETFGESVVGREAQNIAGVLGDRAACAMVAVTTAEPLAIKETLEVRRSLADLQIETAAIFFNRVSPAEFTEPDIVRMTGSAADNPALGHIGALAQIAGAELKRRSRERRALAVLRRHAGCDLFEIEESRGISGRNLTHRMIAQLDRYA